MAIRYSLVNTETGAASGFPGSPAAGAAQTVNAGFNIAGGPIESIIFRFTGTLNAAGDVDGDLMQCVSAVRVILNGETFFDVRSGYSDAADTTASQLGYFMNSLGESLSTEVVASTTVKEAYLRIPCGRQAPPGVSRIEYTMSTIALAAQATGTSVETWVVYNDNMQTRTTVPAATSQVMSGTGQDEVVVRIPSNEPGVIAGVMILNDRDTDGDISEIRVVSQSDYSLETNYWRYLNHDLFNGVLFGSSGSQQQLQIAQQCPGGYFLNLFGLARGDDLRLQVTTTAARTVLFQPVLVAPANASEGAQPSQTQAVRTNTSQAILDRSGAANQ